MVLTEAPIVIPEFNSIKKHCKSCAYQYNYILANPSGKIYAEGGKNKYLVIETNTQDTDEVSSKLIDGRGILREARLYSPPQNDYKNNTDNIVAELILIHSNRDNEKDNTLSVCIPIKKVGTATMNSEKQFSSIINALKIAQANQEVAISASAGGFTLNNFIPRSKYIVLEGVKATWDSSSEKEKNNILIFKDAIHIKISDFNILKNIIDSDGTTTNSVDGESYQIRKYDKKVNYPGLNQRSGMKCFPVDLKTGKRIKPGYMSTSDGNVVGYEQEKESSITGTTVVIGVLGVIGLIVLGSLVYTFYKRAALKAAKAGSNMAKAAAENIGASVKSSN